MYRETPVLEGSEPSTPWTDRKKLATVNVVEHQRYT